MFQKDGARNISLGIVFLIFLLTLAFLWQEKLNFQEKINAEKLSAYGTMLSSLLSVYSIYLIRLQILEAVEQRKSGTRPDLFPDSCFILSEEQSIDPPNIFPSLKFYNYPEIPESQYAVGFKLYNFGQGTAKNISIEWDFDADDASEKINNYFEDPGYIDSGLKVNFLKTNDFTIISPPELVLYAVSSRVLGSYTNQGPPRKTFHFKAKIKYHDSYDSEHFKTFSCKAIGTGALLRIEFTLM